MLEVENPVLVVNRILETSLYVNDIESSLAFYQSIFAFSLLTRDERMCALAVPGRQTLLLFKRDGSTCPSYSPAGLIPGHNAQGTQHLCFSVDREDLDRWTQHLANCGVTLEARLDWPQGASSLYFRDLDGHSIEAGTSGLWANDPLMTTVPAKGD